MFFLSAAVFLKSLLSGILSEHQTVGIQVRLKMCPNCLQRLLEHVYYQTLTVATSGERVKGLCLTSDRLIVP